MPFLFSNFNIYLNYVYISLSIHWGSHIAYLFVSMINLLECTCTEKPSFLITIDDLSLDEELRTL